MTSDGQPAEHRIQFEADSFRHQIRIARGTATSLFGAAISAVLGLAATGILSRRLGFDDLGLYALGFAVCLFASLCSRLGLEVSTLRFPSAHLSRLDLPVASATARRALRIAVLLGCVSAPALYFLAPGIAVLLGQPDATVVLRMFAPAVPLVNLLYVATEALRGSQRLVQALLPRLVVFPGILIVGFGAVLGWQRTLAAAVAVTIFAWAVAGLVAFSLFVRAYPHRSTPASRDALLHFGAWSLGMQLLHFGVFWLPVALLARFANPTDMGLVRVASQTALLSTIVVTGFESLFAPVCSFLLARGDFATLDAASKAAARKAFILTGAGVLFVLLDPDLVLPVFGPNIRPAIPSFLILLLGQMFGSILGPAPYALVMGGRIPFEVTANVVALTVGTGGGLLLVPSYGMAGAALGTAFALLVRAGLRWVFLRLEFSISPFSTRLFVGIAGFGVLLLLGYFVVSLFPWPRLLVALFASTTFLGGGARWIASPKDREVIARAAALVDFEKGAMPVSQAAPRIDATGHARPAVSVVVCTRNRPRLVLGLLNNLGKQTQVPDEIVVVDGSPQDGLAELLAKFESVRYVHLPESRGLTQQRNAGVNASRGDICVFLDDDVIPNSNFLATILDTYLAHPDAGGVGGVPYAEKRLSPLRRTFLKVFQRGPFAYPSAFYDVGGRRPVQVHRFSGCAQSYSRNVLSRIRFDETIMRPQRGEDIDMSWRVSREYPLYLAPAARVHHEALGWKALDLSARFQAKVVSYRSLYIKNLRGSRRMSFLFGWLMVGIIGEALLYCLIHRSLLPMLGLQRGLLSPVLPVERAGRRFASAKKSRDAE